MAKKRKKKKQQDAPGADGVTLLREFEPHGGIIMQISFRADGRQFVTASRDNTLKTWDTGTGACLRTLTGHGARVTSCDWSPDTKSNVTIDGGQVANLSHASCIVSGAGDKTVRVWDPETGVCLDTLVGHSGTVCSTAWSSDGQRIVSGSADNTARLWSSSAIQSRTSAGQQSFAMESLATGMFQSATKYATHQGVVNSCRFLADGQHAVSGSDEKNVRVLAIDTGETLAKLPCGSLVYSVSVGLLDDRIAAACEDRTIRIWSRRRSRETSEGFTTPNGHESGYGTATTLEGHTARVTSCAFSPDGRLLASKAYDNTVRLWRTDTWQTVAVLQEVDPGNGWDKLCFHPTQPILATPGERDKAVRLWELDYSVLLGDKPAAGGDRAVHYTTARIALVGDSGVGKTGLGWRIAHGEFKEHKSTHGQQFWVIDELGTTREDGTQCEAVLWDFAGQDDYRLVHSLFLGEVDLGLLLFDPGRRDKPLAGVEFWVKQFRHNARELLRTMLVAARSDRGQPTLTIDELDGFCADKRISGGHIATSAQSGSGVDELLERLRELIPWERFSTTVTTATFKRVKDFVLKLKEARDPEANTRKGNMDLREGEAPAEPHVSEDDETARREPLPPESRVLVEPAELRAMLEADDADWEFTDAEMMTAVRHLASHGYVTVCEQSDGDESILLFPDVLIGLASSMVNAARGNPNGLGALIENEIDTDRYRFPELDGLEPDERETLIETAVRLFLQQHICFRESDTSGSRTFLVFPSLINEKRPKTGELETVESTSYHLEGGVETVYPALVVLLGYTDDFSRTNQWQDQAQYAFREDEVCGFRQITEHEGETELVLYFGTDTPQDSRTLFQAMFERFLRGRDVQITRYAPIHCPSSKCGRKQERVAVMNLIAEGERQAFCNKCGTGFELPAAEAISSLAKSDDPRVEAGHVTADQRTWFQSSLVRVKAIVRDENKQSPSCFISYAWGVPEHEKWVHQLADDLRDASINGLLDIKHNVAGTDIDDFIEKILDVDFVVVVGTPRLLKKYHARDSDPVVKAEMKLVNTRKMEPNRFGANRVIPVMLNGESATSLTPQLQNTVFVDFRDRRQYFDKLFQLVLTLHQISPDHPGIVALQRDSSQRLQR